MSVSQLVEADAALLAVAHQPLPRLREEVRVDRSAVGVGEHELVTGSHLGRR